MRTDTSVTAAVSSMFCSVCRPVKTKIFSMAVPSPSYSPATRYPDSLLRPSLPWVMSTMRRPTPVFSCLASSTPTSTRESSAFSSPSPSISTSRRKDMASSSLGLTPTSCTPRVSRSDMMTAGTTTRDVQPTRRVVSRPGCQSAATSKLFSMDGSAWYPGASTLTCPVRFATALSIMSICQPRMSALASTMVDTATRMAANSMPLRRRWRQMLRQLSWMSSLIGISGFRAHRFGRIHVTYSHGGYQCSQLQGDEHQHRRRDQSTGG